MTGRVLLLDGHSMAFRAFFGLPPENFTNSKGQATNAVYGFVSMLVNVVKAEAPSHIGVAFDQSGPTFRTAIYGEYKGGRAETPPEFKGQVPMLERLLEALGIRTLSLPDYEADDIIATWTEQALSTGHEVLILSGDRDAFQLVSDRSTVLYPVKGVTDLKRMTPEAVEEKYGVPPQRYPEMAALVGESADNLPGVPKVGPKTAEKWLKEYPSLEDLLAHADDIGGVAGQNLRDHLADVRRNRELNHLIRDLDLAVGLDDLERGAWRRQDVLDLFSEMEFGGSLRGRVAEVFGGGFETAAEAASSTTGSKGASVVEEGAARLETTRPEFSSPFPGAVVLGDGTTYVYDAKTLWVEHPELERVDFDVLLAAYLIAPDSRHLELDALSMKYLARELRPPGDADALFDLEARASEDEALQQEAETIHDLAEVLKPDLDAIGATALMTDMELPLSRLLARMQATGIAVDRDYLVGLEAQFAADVDRAAKVAYEAAGREINLASPKQLQVLLFDELALPATRKTKTGFTTDADALAWLLTQVAPESAGERFLTALLLHRERAKLRGIVEGLLNSTTADGRIHTKLQQTVAATGRLSSIDPNLQNIPVRTEEGRRLRTAFVVGAGYETLMTADYSQIEMRLMAHLSGDEGLIEAFRSGEDFHRVTASLVYRVPPAEVTAEQRSKIKAMNYGLAYGLGAFGLAGQLGVSQAEAKKLMEEYYAIFGGVRAYLDGVVAQAREDGYTETMWGRRRPFRNLHSTNQALRAADERAALNAPIQGSAADLMKIAMLNVDAGMAKAGLRSRMLLQVHDELIFDVASGEREALEELVRHEMGHAADSKDLRVPLDVSTGFGQNWNEAAH